jgi:5-methylcytosine-specific restriction protein A
MPRNPPWARDELILALDLYFRVNPNHTREQHPKILALSRLLNSLPIHPRTSEFENFRNPNGVYMKLCNYLRLDPSYQGVGLKAGGRLEEEVWREFATDRDLLARTAEAIRREHGQFKAPRTPAEAEEWLDEEEFPEGKIITKAHRRKERSKAAVKKKKAQALRQTGKLECEACGFEFRTRYGESSRDIIECHHIKPLAEVVTERTTRLSDLALVCANCHRVLHRVRPWMSITQLRRILGR